MKNLACCLLLLGLPLGGEAEDSYELAPIFYSATEPRDAIQALSRRVAAGEVKLNASGWPLMRDLMKHLDIPVESQVLVFSKTSKQNDRINPRTPRAVYFGDNAYLGYAIGGSVELAVIDPNLGPVFYLSEAPSRRGEPPHFERDSSCLSCHGGPFSPDVPGVLVRSAFPAESGHLVLSLGSTVVNGTTPFEDRWGGWYVTGRHGEARHRGNITVKELPGGGVEVPVERGANVTDLSTFFDVRPYPRATSDIVALMVLEHQSGVQNLLTKAHQSAVRARHMQRQLQRELGEPISAEPEGTALRILENVAEDVLDALLFKDEATLPEGGIEGDEVFQAAFLKNARRSAEGRSLKDFQLLTRLFKYRCSYMIYSITFQHMEPALKAIVLWRLRQVLEGEETSGRYDYLGQTERSHIRQILSETLPEFNQVKPPLRRS